MRRPLIDEEIRTPEVRVVLVDDGDPERRPTREMVALARERGLHLTCDPADTSDAPRARLARVALPVRWERGPAPLVYPSSERAVDERLWCTVAFCDGRHYLLASNQTFPGRLRIACPTEQRTHTVSASELVTLSSEASYWLQGFLTASAPALGRSGEGEPLTEDLAAWGEAEALFVRSGYWSVTPRTCDGCGVLRLPSSPGESRCAACAQGPA